jgi:hypothetical protein
MPKSWLHIKGLLHLMKLQRSQNRVLRAIDNVDRRTPFRDLHLAFKILQKTGRSYPKLARHRLLQNRALTKVIVYIRTKCQARARVARGHVTSACQIKGLEERLARLTVVLGGNCDWFAGLFCLAFLSPSPQKHDSASITLWVVRLKLLYPKLNLIKQMDDASREEEV